MYIKDRSCGCSSWAVWIPLLPHSRATIPQIQFKGSNISFSHSCILIWAFVVLLRCPCVLFYTSVTSAVLVPSHWMQDTNWGIQVLERSLAVSSAAHECSHSTFLTLFVPFWYHVNWNHCSEHPRCVFVSNTSHMGSSSSFNHITRALALLPKLHGSHLSNQVPHSLLCFNLSS